jgi:hypothetical protein
MTGQVTDVLERSDVQSQLKSALAYFAVVGFGLGATGFLMLNQLLSSLQGGSGSGGLVGRALVGVLGLVVLLTILVIGPMLAAVVTSRMTGAIDLSRGDLYIVGFVGSYAGYVVMIVIATVLLSLGVPSGGSSGSMSFDLGQLLVPLLIMGIPSGIVGVATVFVENRFPLHNMGQHSTTSR